MNNNRLVSSPLTWQSQLIQVPAGQPELRQAGLSLMLNILPRIPNDTKCPEAAAPSHRLLEGALAEGSPLGRARSPALQPDVPRHDVTTVPASLRLQFPEHPAPPALLLSDQEERDGTRPPLCQVLLTTQPRFLP